MDKSRSKYIFFAVFIILLVLSFFVIKPFITSILTSIVLAYLFYPLYQLLNKKLNKTFSAVIVLLIAILLFVVPFFFITQSLVKESIGLYNIIKNSSIAPLFDNILDNFLKFVLQESQSLIKSIPSFLIHVFITFFLFYYFLKEGEKIIISLKNLTPLDNKHKEIVFKEFRRVTSAVVYGLILIGIIVGAFSVLGFYIFKVSNPILLGLLTILVSVLPGIGTSIIWAPIAILRIIQGDYSSGIGLFIYGFIFVSGFEVLFKPKLISYKSDIHPTLVVVGVFGGIALLGFIGIFFGPLILVTFITFLKHLLDKN